MKVQRPAPGSWTFADDGITRLALFVLLWHAGGWGALAVYLVAYAAAAVAIEMFRVSREVRTINEEAASIVGRAVAESMAGRASKPPSNEELLRRIETASDAEVRRMLAVIFEEDG